MSHPRHITEQGVKNRLFQVIRERQAGSWIGRIAGPVIDSLGAEETYLGGGTPPPMEETAGQVELDTFQEYLFTLKNVKHSTGIKVPIELWRRAARNQGSANAVRRMVDMLGIREVQHWGRMIIKLMLMGGTKQSYDKSNFFATDHALKKSSETNSNLHSKAATNGTTPTPLEFAEAVVETKQKIHKMLDDHGEPMLEDVMEFDIFVPNALETIAELALTKELMVDQTANSVTDSPIKRSKMKLNLVSSVRLETGFKGVSGVTDRFYMTASGMPMTPFVRQQEILERISLGEGTEHQKKHDELVWQIKASRAAGFADYQMAHCTVFV